MNTQFVRSLSFTLRLLIYYLLIPKCKVCQTLHILSHQRETLCLFPNTCNVFGNLGGRRMEKHDLFFQSFEETNAHTLFFHFLNVMAAVLQLVRVLRGRLEKICQKCPEDHTKIERSISSPTDTQLDVSGWYDGPKHNVKKSRIQKLPLLYFFCGKAL